MKNGATVAAFEREFAAYVGAKYAIALCNGTATLHTAVVALGVNPGDRVAVPPLTMSSTTIAVLHAGAVPVFSDVDPFTWLMERNTAPDVSAIIPVSLYGLHHPARWDCTIDDAAQTLRPHSGCMFTSYSFQASKILALGEGGMLVTDSEELAIRAREFSSLGYPMRADQPRIDPDALKSPTFDRHYSLGFNYRMADLVAERGLMLMGLVREGVPVRHRRENAALYRDAIQGCDWLTPQHVPDGWEHDYWTFAIACDTPARAIQLADKIVSHGGERPYPAWKLAYQERAFLELGYPEHAAHAAAFNEMPGFLRHNTPRSGLCPVAESLQPRLLQFATNDLASAERNATALRLAIQELSA